MAFKIVFMPTSAMASIAITGSTATPLQRLYPTSDKHLGPLQPCKTLQATSFPANAYFPWFSWNKSWENQEPWNTADAAREAIRRRKYSRLGPPASTASSLENVTLTGFMKENVFLSITLRVLCMIALRLMMTLTVSFPSAEVSKFSWNDLSKVCTDSLVGCGPDLSCHSARLACTASIKAGSSSSSQTPSSNNCTYFSYSLCWCCCWGTEGTFTISPPLGWEVDNSDVSKTVSAVRSSAAPALK